MGLNTSPEMSSGVWGSIKGALGLFSDTNKAQGGIGADNDNPELIDEYESKLPDVEIVELITRWKRDYSVYYDPIEKGQKLSFDYWVGKHRDPYNAIRSTNDTAITDNLIFKAIETFLPVATRANPEPLVTADPSDIGQSLAKDIKVALAHEADVQQLRRKLAKMTRQWMLNRIGVLKVTWNVHTKKIETNVINSKRMVFDRDGYIDERGYFIGEYVGEKKKASANDLMDMFPKRKELINKKCKGKLGTMLEYYEWWYNGTDLFYSIDDSVLGKYKNPNWNYDQQAMEPNNEGLEEGQPPMEAQPFVAGVNHLDEPTAPYRFLAIFNTGEQPHDNTSLILQNLAGQDEVNRRKVQIDRNVEGMNNGMVVSGTAFTEEQASQAATALRRGVAIRVPNGDVQKAVMFPQKPALPSDVFESLRDTRSELENIFGTSGLTSEGVKSQETVRGKIMVNQADSSRIGGGITEYIEQVADSIYNLWVQFMYVYYDEEHYVAAAGATSGMELIALKNSNFPLLKTLTVTVKEGSLIPKDPLTQRNEAIDLWSANAIDPLTLYKKLDVPNPQEAANQLILWQMLQKGQIMPQQYLEGFAVAGQNPGQMPMGMPMPGEQPGTGGPAVSPVAGAETPQQPAPAPSQDAAAAQSKQLLGAVPLK